MLRDVYDRMLVCMYALAAIGVYELGVSALVVFFLATTGAVVAEAVAYTIRKRNVTFTGMRKSLITGALVGFLVPYNAQFYVPLATSVVAIASKHIVRLPQKKHFFNPAAFGALVCSLAFGFAPFWWGAVNPYATYALGLALIYSFKRLELPLTFLLVSVAFSMAFGIGVRVLTDNLPLVFLAFFMLTEPITSPFYRNGRIVYGALAAVLVFATTFLGRFDALLGGLLLANLATPAINRFYRTKLSQ